LVTPSILQYVALWLMLLVEIVAEQDTAQAVVFLWPSGLALLCAQDSATAHAVCKVQAGFAA